MISPFTHLGRFRTNLVLLLLGLVSPALLADNLPTPLPEDLFPDLKDILRTALAQIRQQGWALSEQQLELGYRGIAVPLRDSKGEAVAALSVTMPTGHESSEAAVARVLPVLRDAAQTMRNLL